VELSTVIGRAYGALGDYVDAERMFREALALYQKLRGNENPRVASLLGDIASMASFQGRHAESETLERETLALWKKLKGEEDPQVAYTLDRSAMVLLRQSQAFETPANQRLLKEAETLEREALAMSRKLLGNEHPDVATALGGVTQALLDSQKFTEAELPARECLAIREKKSPDDWQTFNARSVLGGSLLGQKKYVEAESLLISGYEGMKQREEKISAGSKRYLKETLQRLMQLYQAMGQSEKAAEWSKRLAEFDKTEAEKKTAAANP